MHVINLTIENFLVSFCKFIATKKGQIQENWLSIQYFRFTEETKKPQNYAEVDIKIRSK